MSPTMSSLCQFCFALLGSLKMIELPCCKKIYHAFCMDILLDEDGYACPSCKKRLPQQKVDEIRIESYHKTTCGICHQAMTCRKKLNPCDHWFHLDCLSRWTQDKNTCPTCSLEISSPGMEQIRLAIEHRAMRAFLKEDTEITKKIPVSLKKYLYRTISADYPSVDEDSPEEESTARSASSWTKERVLSTLFLRHEDSMPPTIKKYFKDVIGKVHKCNWECEEGLCLVKVWVMDKVTNVRRCPNRRSAVTPTDPKDL